MDIQEIIQGLGTQGPVFWTAAASVALGLTMLLVAGVFQIRGAGNRPLPGKQQGGPVAGVGNRVDVTDHGYQLAPTSPQKTAPVPTSDLSGELTHLLARLKQTSKRLQEVHDALPEAPVGAEQVLLKGTGGGVDYVFKAGVG